MVLPDEIGPVLKADPKHGAFLWINGSFVIVPVTNAGWRKRTLFNILARLEYRTEGDRIEVDGAWSKEPGARFIPDGPRTVDIGYGDSRTLVLALYSEDLQTWVQLGREDWPPDYVQSPRDGSLINRTTSRRVALGATCKIVLRLSGDGLSEKQTWHLTFQDGQPHISPSPRPPTQRGSLGGRFLRALRVSRRVRWSGTLQDKVPWRHADAVCRAFDELRVDFDHPRDGDLGSYRSDEDWDKRYWS